MRKKTLENFNWPLAGGVAALILLGLTNLYSALSVWGEGGLQPLFWNQVVWFFIGLTVLAGFTAVDYRLWDKLGVFFYGLSLFSLLLVLLVGHSISGHQSWIHFGVFSVQPAEFAKIGLVFMLAKFFSDNPSPFGFGFFRLLKPITITAVPFFLVILQKDLGSSLFFPLIFLTLAFVAKIKKSTVFIFLCLLTIGGGVTYQYGLKSYQKDRLKIFLNPESDPRRSGYHLIQSKIAVGSGRFLGKGYMKGRINKLKYLPDKHTDFIFPVLAEEWGFFGSLVTLLLYLFLLGNGLWVAIKARELYGSFLAAGITAILFWHFVINIGGVLGMIPLTGVPLPFLSYGGSSTIAFMIGIGLLLNVHMRRFMF